MAAKKTAAKKAKKPGVTARLRKADQFTSAVKSTSAGVGASGNGAPKKRARPKNAEAFTEESEEIQRANELTLRVWESIYARRAKLRKLYWVK